MALRNLVCRVNGEPDANKIGLIIQNAGQGTKKLDSRAMWPHGSKMSVKKSFTLRAFLVLQKETITLSRNIGAQSPSNSGPHPR